MKTPEKLFPLAKAVEKATGQRPHPSTLHRWRLRGIQGVRLETVRLGGRRYCSVEAVHRFRNKLTETVDGDPTPRTRTQQQRAQAVDRAEQELREQGF